MGPTEDNEGLVNTGRYLQRNFRGKEIREVPITAGKVLFRQGRGGDEDGLWNKRQGISCPIGASFVVKTEGKTEAFDCASKSMTNLKKKREMHQSGRLATISRGEPRKREVSTKEK